MPPERWRQIEAIFNAALEREAALRPVFVEDACCGDQALRRQVEALLQQDGESGELLSEPIEQVADEVLSGGATKAHFVTGSMAGPYRIGERLGAGGMGEVYRAQDTRLDRTVAIKTLKARFTERFEREARAISALNHPNICTLYDIGSQDGIGYLVMEYVDGGPLKGPLPVAEALRLAIQIAGALAAAHEKGILHRDLKPGNILVSRGEIKLLDFGLAKIAPAGSRLAEETVTAPLTETGQVLGTLAYMAPEQIEGKPADARSDLFSFGLVLYEILSGRRAFESTTQTGLMANILKEGPLPLTTLVPSIPAALERTVRKCLAKEPARRWQTASDLRDELVWIADGESTAPRAIPRRVFFPWIAGAAGLFALIAATSLWGPWRASPTAADGPFLQMDLETGPDEVSQPAISSDGMRTVFVSKGNLAMRRLDEKRIAPLAGTEGASSPFFSPDGKWVAFFAHGKLQKIAVDGGAPVTLCNALRAGGGTWGDDDTIVAALNSTGELSRVNSAGGVPQPLGESKGEVAGTPLHLWPQTLPDGKGILYGASNGNWQGSLRVLTPHNGLKTIVENSTHGRYLASGYLVYHQLGTLFAAPMDPVRLELTGPAVPLVDGVSYSDTRADFDLSASGTLVYYRNTSRTNNIPSWLYSSGKIEPLLLKPGNYFTPRLSPDGKRLALSLFAEGKQNLWVYDFGRQMFNRLTFSAEPDSYPAWTPDGEFLVFRSGSTLAWTRSDGSGKLERLAAVNGNVAPWSFSSDGKWLAFWPIQPDSDLWIVPVERAPGVMQLGRPQLLLQQASSKGAPAISPDGRWLAYASAESGTFEIYVRPFAPQGTTRSGKWPVSNEGGAPPVWSRNGRDLFYQNGRRVQVAAYTIQGDSFLAEKPRFWSERWLADIGFMPGFDVAPDGTRVLALMASEDAKPDAFLRVLLNVGGELRRRTPGRGK